MSCLRCFVGLALPEPAAAALVRCKAVICERDASWADQKWVPPQNLHVTIAFLGAIDSEQVPGISRALSACASSVDGLGLRFTRLEAAPRVKRASVLWARVEDDGTAARLATAMGEWLAPYDIARDIRPFVPHVTLVRARRPMHAPESLAQAYADSSLECITVSDPPITLFSSRLTKTGPVYEKLASFGSKGVL